MPTDAASHLERAVSQRFEAKYMIRETQAMAIREFIASHMRPDVHGREYPVLSVYLDSSRLGMFWSSELGEKNRAKLRIRAYEDDPERPVFFEIKRRVDQVIRKHRASVKRESVPDFLEGCAVSSDWMAKPDDHEGMANLHQFREMMDAMSATPRVAVRYQREAYVSDREEAVRITFDRALSCLPTLHYDPSIWADANPWRDLRQAHVILEIKFTDAFPSWVKRLIQRFELHRDSFAKYVACIKALRNEGVPVEGTYRSVQVWNSWHD
jgi:hypothetical protein